MRQLTIQRRSSTHRQRGMAGRRLPARKSTSRAQRSSVSVCPLGNKPGEYKMASSKTRQPSHSLAFSSFAFQMKSFTSLTLLSLVSVAVAWSEPAGHEYQKPGPNDQRSPCPGLNSLANHGYLPRNGQNITVPQILNAALEGFNYDWAVLLLAAKNGLLTRTDKGSETNMSLEPLVLHNLIERDASLSRDDYRNGTGDNLHFNETIYSFMANSNPGVDYYNTTSTAHVMYQNLEFSKATNPTLINTQKEVNARAGTAALALTSMGNATTGVAPKQFVDILFREERLPFLEGWQRSPVLITLELVAPLVEAMVAGSNWTATQSCEPIVQGPGNSVDTAA
ncbi:HEME-HALOPEROXIDASE domain-containing protein [Mycena chlorophos]|uniref:HEME-HALOPEROXIDASE domain-containing protein n=1 Tax=Mycena chlorophos TaxID=658473 RepID=A0A8H6W4E3_MYCCL|nr:HEME-HALOPEROXIDASE domain-containing protein [Mycena chlorophos]